ncbi:hypothetical protein ACWEQ3_42430 [Streptomyces mirabilis]
MADEADQEAQRRGDALAYVCAHLDELRDDLRSDPEGGDGPLDRLLAAVRGDGDVDASLAELHAVMQAGGDALGVYGATRGLRPVGLGRDPTETVYVCPAGRCSRYWWPQAATTVPRCEMGGGTLRRVRL